MKPFNLQIFVNSQATTLFKPYSKLKLITDFFKSKRESEPKNSDCQIGSTQREMIALINNGAWNCIGTATGSSILTVSGVLTNDFSQTEQFRTAVVRQHVHKSLIKCLLLKCDNKRILKSIKIVTIDCLNHNNAADLGRLGLFNICNIDENVNHDEPIPVTIICTDSPDQLDVLIL